MVCSGSSAPPFFPGDRQRVGPLRVLIPTCGSNSQPGSVSIRSVLTWGEWTLNINYKCSKGNVVLACELWLCFLKL